MAMELMLNLARRQLPVTLDHPAEIDKLRILAAADFVRAVLPDVSSPQQQAQVLAFTPQGRAAMRMAFPELQFDFSAATASTVRTESSDPSDAAEPAHWSPSMQAWHVTRRDRPSTRWDA